MEKFTSRKFIVSLIGVLIGVLTCYNGQYTEGATIVCTSIIGYLAAEGYVDSKAVKKIVEVIDEVTDGVKEELEKDKDGE